MKANDYIANLVLLSFALFVMSAAYDLGLGTLRVPGMGFTAFWTAFILAALSVAHFVVISMRMTEPAAAPLFGTALVTKIVPAFAALFIGTWLMPMLGFFTVTCLLIIALVWTVQQRLTVGAFPVAIITALCCHLLFQTLLGGQFPRGAFGF